MYGIYAIIRQFDYVQSNSSQIFSEDVLLARSSTMYSGGYKNGQGRKHSQVAEVRMYTGTHDTKKCDTCFERRRKHKLLPQRRKEIYSWAY